MRNRKGQSTLEVAVLMVVIAAAVVTMAVYVKRAIQGRVKQSSDEIGESFDLDKVNALVTTTVTSTVKVDSKIVDTKLKDANNDIIYGIESKVDYDENVNKGGYEKIGW